MMANVKLEKSEKVTKLILKEPRKKSKNEAKNKLRSLIKKKSSEVAYHDNKSDECENIDIEISSRWKKKRWLFALLVLSASVFLSSINISRCGFWATYENNYNKIVYGDERHCYRNLEPKLIIDKLKDRVIGQDDAIGLIEASLNLVNREKIIQLALMGGTGVGKTLSANILMENFHWKPVISLIFDINFKTNLNGPTAFDDDFKEVSSRLKDCGFNLVVIDDIHLSQSNVERIVELERKLHRMAKQNLFKIVLVVIFNGNSSNYNARDKLKNFVQVDFNNFTEELFQNCIALHEKLHNVELKPKDIAELKFINFTEYGCKTLAKKLNLISNKS